MSPIAALHATQRRHRESIIERGLLCSRPASNRPFGVFAFTTGDDFSHPTRGSSLGASRVIWMAGVEQDVWLLSYIGPLMFDGYVENGLILLDRVPPSNLTLL